MSYTIEPSPTRLHIWQQNLNKSDKAHYDLINTPLHKNWDILALQEPYTDALGNTRANSQWHVVYPSPHHTDSSIDRLVILINLALDVNKGAQIPVEDSNDVMAIQLWCSSLRGHLPCTKIFAGFEKKVWTYPFSRN